MKIKLKQRFCSICKNELDEYGHNPWPLKSKGQCCSMCNLIVIAARLKEIQYEKNN